MAERSQNEEKNAEGRNGNIVHGSTSVPLYSKSSELPVGAASEDDDFDRLAQRFGRGSENTYYKKVSKRYRNAKLLLSVLLVVFVVFAIILGSESLTYANLQYMLRNFSESSSSDDERSLWIRIETAGEHEIAAYNNRIVTADESGIAFYRVSGKKIYSDSVSFGSPELAVGGKYCILWSCGSGSYAVFNTVSLIKNETLDHPIYDVATSDSGNYAILTKSAEYSSSVRLYNSDFNLTAVFNKSDAYISDLALSLDGTLLASAAFYAENGIYNTVIELFDSVSGEKKFSQKLSDAFPVKCGFFEDGSLYLVTNKSLQAFSLSGEQLFSSDFNGTPVISDSFGNVFAVLVSDESGKGEYVLLAMSSKGDKLLDISAGKGISDICLCDGAVVLLGSDIRRISFEDGGTLSAVKDPGAGELLLCGEAVYCVYGDSVRLVFNSDEPYAVTNDQN